MTLRKRLRQLEAQQALRIERAKELRAQIDAIIEVKQLEIMNLRAQVENQGLRIA